MSLQVLTWNLMHGRSVPPSGRALLSEFGDALAGWDWDVALLQEVPPWWPALLGLRLGASWELVLTSRNWGLSARRAVAVRAPDLIKSNGGGANAVLARGLRVRQRRTLRLAVVPERRWLLAVHLVGAAGRSVWVGNLHASGWPPRAPAREARRASAAMLSFAGSSSEPVVLGGDFNLRTVALPGLTLAGGVYVDHVFARGLRASGEPAILDRGVLSDHAPVRVVLE